MRHKIEFGGEPQDVTITLSGVATQEGFQRVNEARLSDERFQKRLLILLDAVSLDDSRMSEQQLEAAIEPMIESERERPPLALAIVARQTLREAIRNRTHLGGSMSRRRVFASREDALAWLREQQRVG
jgi:hypothetical protein